MRAPNEAGIQTVDFDALKAKHGATIRSSCGLRELQNARAAGSQDNEIKARRARIAQIEAQLAELSNRYMHIRTNRRAPNVLTATDLSARTGGKLSVRYFQRLAAEEEERTLLEFIIAGQARVGQPGHARYGMLFAMICCAIDTGLRSEEQLNCQWTEIDLENNQVTVPHERAKSGVGVLLLPRTVKLLKALPRQRHHASPGPAYGT